MIKYRAFIKTVELGSITKAAEFLGYSQPGLSHILNSLEDRVGFPLLIRTKSSVEPTEDGKRLLEYCYRIIEAEDSFLNAANSIKGILSGTIHIGAPNSMLVRVVPQVINEFHKVYPNVEIFIQEDTLLETQKNLHRGKIEVAFLTDQAPDVDFYPLFEDKILLAMHQNHPFTQYKKVPTKALDNCAFIMQLPGWDDIANIVLKDSDIRPDIKHYSASDAASFAMVSNYLGVYIISELQLPLLPANVTTREFEDDFSRTIGIAIKSTKAATPAQKEFIRIAQNIKELLPPPIAFKKSSKAEDHGKPE